jgi:hypothetical protein
MSKYRGGKLIKAETLLGDGDLAVFGFDYPHDPSYGYVEIITKQKARHYRRQTRMHRARLLLARLADSVRGK